MVGLGFSSPRLDAGLLRIPCSAALCTALSKKVVEVSLVAHLAEAAGRSCWPGIVEPTVVRGNSQLPSVA